jgi:hypothetical protein
MKRLLAFGMVTLVAAGGGSLVTGCNASSRITQSTPTSAPAAITGPVNPPGNSGGPSSGIATADLAAVQQDLADIDSATNQAGTDLSAGDAAQAENDNP